MLRSQLALLVLLTSCSVRPLNAEEPVDFRRDIRPILSDKCFTCHGPDDNTRKADLRLDLESAATRGDSAPIVAGNPKESELIRRILSEDADERMPPADSNKQLTKAEKKLLQRWVKEGAKWATHWAYVAPKRWAPPKVDGLMSLNPIDKFVRARLQSAGITPSNTADRVTLIRRLYFDLIGLPPTPEEVQAFVEDSSPNAYEKVVEHLMTSQHFGERLAVYWLDVVRFADSNGYHSDEARRIAPYRDYVIEAFNNNMPYDRFVIEQLAGDLLPNPTVKQQVASGFNMLLQTTSEGGAQAKEYIAKYAADRVRNTSQIFLGSTLGCAECHNHKFDPFTQADFYSFAAFFADIQQPAVGNPATFPVMLDGAKQTIDGIDRRLAQLQQTLNTSSEKVLWAQADWETAITSEAKSSPTLSPWHQLPPFKGANIQEVFAKAYIDPKAARVGQPIGKLKWVANNKFTDGKVIPLPAGDNTAHYLLRTVTVDTDSKIALSLGSDDTLTVFVNGKQVHANKASRAAAPDQDKIEVQLKKGVNQLLLKIGNGGGNAGFYFRATASTLPANVLAILKTDTAKRSSSRRQELAKYYRSITPLLSDVRKQVADLSNQKKQTLARLPRTMMTKTGKPRVVRLLNRGNWMDDSGPEMKPAVPTFLGTLATKDRRANRLDLAHWIVDKDNPLTSRTFVNRLWKIYFGQGLATPLDDFGRQGTIPTHPKLLDWLAVEFMESGWDIKHMIHLMVMSDTYRQSSKVNAELAEKDPYNQLYARQARYRLDAEIVRDNALAISGLLVRDIGGGSVHPYQPVGYWRHMNFPTRTWPKANGTALYRRGVYTWWQRMFLHPAMLAFDAPSREECTVERARSNIPQQALVLLNDPTFFEAARVLAERILSQSGTDEERIEWAWRQVLSRKPEPRETSIVLGVLRKHRAQYKQKPDEAKAVLGVGQRPANKEFAPDELAAWTSVARILMNLHETITRS